MKSASYSAIAALIPPRFMRRLIFQHCDLWHFPGRVVPNESPATSGWRLSRAATQPWFQADLPRALLTRVHLLSLEEKIPVFIHPSGTAVRDATSAPSTGILGHSPAC